MAKIHCPQCGELTKNGRNKVWQLIVAFCFGILGWLILLYTKKPTICQNCGYSWLS